MFTAIHKGLRRALCETLVTIGCTDADEPQAVDATLRQVRGVVQFCAEHLRLENQFVHTAMELRRAGSSATSAEQHREHETQFRTLLALATAIAQGGTAARRAGLAELYRTFAAFVAENCLHMAEEEARDQATLWALFDDIELLAIEGQIVAAHTPEEMAFAMTWMLPALSPAERVELLGSARAGMPPAAFVGFLDFACSLLDERGARHLRQVARGARGTQAPPQPDHLATSFDGDDPGTGARACRDELYSRRAHAH